MKPYDKTLTDAITHYLAHLAAVDRTCTVSESIIEFTKAKRTDGAREPYLKDLTNRLARFEIEFGNRKLAEIRGQEIDHWLRALEVAPQTRNNFRTVLRTFFEFAVSRDYAPARTQSSAPQPLLCLRPLPAVLTPTRMKKLLAESQLDLVPWVVIGGFAGLRSIEIERLNWSTVDLGEHLITVSAENSRACF